MIEALSEFHFLRPEWFYALIPAALLYLIVKARSARSSNWERAIDPGLLPYLLETSNQKTTRNPLFLVLLAWVIATVALAGPVFRKTPQPVHERENALVVVFDLTRSMYAEDVQPNRLVRARRKLQDLLAARDEGVTGLIVYAGDAHTVSPLTDDANTIAEMIPAISPSIMPAPGSTLAPALERAQELFHDAGVSSGRILIITDEIRDLAQAQKVASEFRYSYPVSVLAVGTPEGAPIPGDQLEDSGYLKDGNGVLVIPKVDLEKLREFAGNAGGRFARMTLTDEDLAHLLADEPLANQDEFRALERDFDVWIEEGPWLALLLLPLAALAFRRGWLWCLPLFILLPGEDAHASLWDDLWKTRDQQAMQALNEGDAERAASLFEDPEWKASAEYRAEDFPSAAKAFANQQSSDGQYNLGNALAKQGQYEQAIGAYEEALDMNPENEDAAFNKQLIEELLKQRQQQQQQNQQDESDQNQQQQNRQPQEGGEQDQQQDQAGNEQQEGEQQEQQQAENPEQESEQQQGRQQMAQEDSDPLDDEERQALEQWLRRVPDDPGGLLRRKFELQHAERMRQRQTDRNDAKNW